MELGALLMVVLGFAAAGGITAFVVKSSLRGYRERNEVVERSDAAFRRIAAALGLEFREGEVHDHPVIGRIKSFGRLRGRVQGVELKVQVAFDSPGSGVVHFSTEVAVQPAARARPLDAARLGALAPEFPEGELALADGWLSFTVRPSESTALGTFGLLDEPRLRDALDRLVSVAGEGQATYR